MIVDFFVNIAKGFVGWLLDFMPTNFVLPDWFTGFAGLVGQVLAGAVGMGVWIPWGFIFVVVTATFALWATGLLLKFARWVLGLLPTMGGG